MAAELRCLSCTLRRHSITSKFFPESGNMLLASAYGIVLNLAEAVELAVRDAGAGGLRIIGFRKGCAGIPAHIILLMEPRSGP